MKLVGPPQIVRLLFVLGVVAAGGAIYALVHGARPLAILLGLASGVALMISSRHQQHL